MIDRLSSLFVRTLREDPADAEVASHRLLVRAGYIRRQAPGIFAWLPLGLRVKNKVETIIREEMARAGAQEMSFPGLLPAETYEATGRLNDFGDSMFRLEDRKGAPMVLAPTHEEAFTVVVKDLYSSYKDLPLTIYQIQDKFRDEARPRAGLLRGRQFTMKDAYSFDVDDEGLAESYQRQRDAYERIFQRLGLEYVIVDAQAGAMGGSKSEEFLHATEVGEDTFVQSPGGYAANVEAYVSTQAPARDFSADAAIETFRTPGSTTIATLVDAANREVPRERPWAAVDTLKHVVLAVVDHEGNREVIVVGVEGDRDADLGRIEAAFTPREVEMATEEDLKAYPQLVPGYIGPWLDGRQVLGKDQEWGIPYYLDARIGEGSTWISGANAADTHLHSLVIGRDVVPDARIEAADVRDGDPAPDGSGPVTTKRGTEIGHVFQLGRKYAEALDLRVLDKNGKLVVVTMGSYGIGVTRDLALVAEQNHDDRGLIWPEAVAPYDVHVIATGKGEVPLQVAEQLAAEAEAAGLEVLLDDRPKESPGVKFGDAELIGVPWILIAGRNAADGTVELWNRRTNERNQVAVTEAVAALLAAREVSLEAAGK
ncbi:proline--tRNA ligase [Gulosibacter chungangensis]|uniref:proline--tRNA ligase n=1 Tax=Gulosibacter chungangensis TaxID=979746 RepID=UPI0017880D75|nr:proline--tRNA ligase [Gulosibacter chungangensis]